MSWHRVSKLCQRLDHLKFPNLWGRFSTDTMFSKVKSIRGHRTAQIFMNGQGYDQFYPMKSKCDANAALMSFIQDTGIPEIAVSDGADEMIHGEFDRFVGNIG